MHARWPLEWRSGGDRSTLRWMDGVVDRMGRVAHARARTRAVGCIAAGYAMLAMAWLPSSPATGSPDEGAHYLRALAVATGQVVGSPPPALANPSTASTTERFMWQTSRTFTLPDRLVPPPTLVCVAFHPERSAACQYDWGITSSDGWSDQISYVGTYQPYLYALPGVFARAGRSFRTGILLGRFATALVCVFLLVVAAAMLWHPTNDTFSLIGMMVAITPMALFMFASVNTSGPEIAGGVCLTAGLLALSRSDPPPRTYWLGAAAGGAMLALGRATGVGMVLVIAGVAWLVCGTQRARERARAGGWMALGAGAAVILSIGAGVIWELSMHFRGAASPDLAIRHVVPALSALPDQFHQQVGVFGWIDTEMPGIVYLGWGLLLTVLVALAYLVGTPRQRWGLTAMLAGYVACEVFIGAVVMAPTGFGMQGRYTLPVAVAVPLVAGEMLRSNVHRLGVLRPRRLPMMIGACVAVLQSIGWFANARRYAVGIGGSGMFLGNSEWHPVGGWGPWVALAAAGSVLLASASRGPVRLRYRESGEELSVGSQAGDVTVSRALRAHDPDAGRIG